MGTLRAMEWLGFLIDLSVGEFSVPAHKIEALKSRLRETKEAKCASARQLAGLIGKIVSMSLGLGPDTQLMTRNLCAVLNCRLAWCHRLTLSDEASQEIDFWLSEITKFNGSHIWSKPSAVRVVYSDASATGYVGYMVEHGNLIANGEWSPDEAKQSSTWRELRAIKMVLESFQSKLKHERVHWFTDNQNVVKKLKQIRGEATMFLSKPLVSARALSQLIGKLNAAAQAIVLALLFYRHLQGDLKNALASGDHGYENVTPISQQAQEELNWWQQHLQTWNGRCLLRGREQIIISSDSSLLGWGATCNGTRTNRRRHGTSTVWKCKQPPWQSSHS